MISPRTIFLIALLGVTIAAASSHMANAGRRGETSAAPATAPPPVVAPTLAPPLFPDGVPVALQTTPNGLANLSAQSCNACHFQAHDDWTTSAHSQGATAEVLRTAVARAGGSPVCLSCHLPLANQHAQLATGYHDGDLSRPQLSPNAIWDATLSAEGVTCAACHVREGKILAARALPEAPHPVAISLELTTSEACAACHQLTWPGGDQPFYDTFGEWSRSAYAAAGVRCQDCHMPPKAGLATASRFAASADHSFHADLGRALSVLIDMDSPDIQRGEPSDVHIRVQNTGAGHHVPTGSPFKAYELVFTIRNEDGDALADPFVHRLAREIGEASPWPTLTDSRLPAGGEISLSHSFTVNQRVKAQSAVLEIAVLVKTPDREDPPHVLQRIPITIR